MDPITQGLLGAAASQSLFADKLGRWAALIGCFAGMIADLDVLYKGPPGDPVHSIVYHRHITHALIFMPLGGLIGALPFLWLPWLREKKKAVLGAAMVAFMTHAPLDLCTSYGTQFWLPFTNARSALDILPIVDLVFTPLLLIGVALCLWFNKSLPARIGLGLALGYAAMGAVNHHRAASVQQMMAQARGHAVEHARVMPLIGSILVWRSVYRDGEGMMHIDAVRTPFFGGSELLEGDALPLANRDEVIAATDDRTEAERVYDVFAWFSDGFLAQTGPGGNVLADMRYSMRLPGIEPLWGLQFQPDRVVRWRSPDRQREGRRRTIGDLLSVAYRGDPRFIKAHDWLIEQVED